MHADKDLIHVYHLAYVMDRDLRRVDYKRGDEVINKIPHMISTAGPGNKQNTSTHDDGLGTCRHCTF